MKIIDRYIARSYITNIVVLFIVLFGFVIATDVFVNLGRFTRQAAEGDAHPVRTLVLLFVLIADFWWPKLLQLFNYLNGVVLITAMGFTCVQLVRHRELVALLASGVSLHRVAAPFLMVAALFTAAQAINQELLVPRVAHLLTRDHGDSGRRSIAAFRVRLAPDGQGRNLSAASYDDEAQVMTDIIVFERDPAGRLLTTTIADEARWDGTGWALINGMRQREDEVDGATARTTVRQPIDRLETPLDPQRIKVHQLQDLAHNLSWTQLTEMRRGGGLANEQQRRLDRIRWGRLGALASTFVALAAALPCFLVRMPQPMMGPTLRAAPVALAGLGAAAAASSLTLPGLPMWLCALLPPLILLPVAMALFTTVRT
jgi:lipopolysaccharide export system permease protein